MIRYALLAAGAALSFSPSAHAQVTDASETHSDRDKLSEEIRRLTEVVAAQGKRIEQLERGLAAPSEVQQAAAVKELREPYCEVTGKTPGQVVKTPEEFAAFCLGPIVEIKQDPKDPKSKVIKRFVDVGWNKFDSLGLGVQLVGSKEDGVVEITPTYTKRFPHSENREAKGRNPAGKYFQNHYLKFRAGVRAPLDPGGEAATFADLTKFERASGLTGVFGLEWGDSRWTHESDLSTLTGKALQAARRECIAEKMSEPATDPLRPEDKDKQPLQLRRTSEILRLCDGMPLIDWIATNKKRRETYYGKMVKPIFGDYSGDSGSAPPARWFAGVEGNYANSTYNFFPLMDPANTGVPLLTELPADFPGGQSQQKHDLYALKAYGGRGIGPQDIGGRRILEAADASLSLTYRRDYTFVDGTADQQICAPAGLVIRCHKRNIAPPYKVQGFIVGSRLGARFPSFGFLPSAAMELRGTYDFAHNRYGLQVPVYLIANDKDVPNGGVMLSCTSKGRTASGLELDRDCRGAIFFGTEFQLDRR